MSVIPVVRQICRSVTLSDGSVRFEVSNQITDPGDLPFPHLFVVTINASADPKEDVLARIATPVDIRQADPTAPIYVKVVSTDLITTGPDTFARIANVNDISKLPRDRVTALLQGSTVYLTTAIALLYDNVTTAEAAAKQIIDTLSSLVTEWRSYNNNFSTNPYKDYTLPQAAIGVQAQRTALYVDARSARKSAEASRDALQVSKDQCDQESLLNSTIYNFLIYDVAFLEQAKAIINSQTGEAYLSPIISPTPTAPPGPYTAILTTTNSRDFVLHQGTFSTNTASYEMLLIKKRTDRDIYAAKVKASTDQCTALAVQLAASQQAVNAAIATERTTLASVIAVCPTFDPSTV